LELGDAEALRLSRQEEGERRQRRAHPVLVADDRHPLEGAGVPGTEAEVFPHRLALDLAAPRAEQIEHPDLAAFGDQRLQDRLDDILPIVVLDIADRLEADRPRRHLVDSLQHRVSIRWLDVNRGPRPRRLWRARYQVAAPCGRN